MNYKGGYAMVDCGGINLLSQSSQTVTGLYAKVGAAYESNKPIIAMNCFYGEGVKLTPIQVFAILEGGVYICTASILQIRVASDDTVTITSLVGAKSAVKKGE